MKPIIQKIVLGGVVMRDKKLLLLQRSANESILPSMWELPSGKREPLEPSESTLRREIKEEAGLNVNIIMPISVFDYQIEKPSEIQDTTQINFLVATKDSREVRLSPEHQAFAWVSEEEIEKYPVSEPVMETLKRSFASCIFKNI